MSVSRETSRCLERYAGLVARWNRAINLVSRAELPQFQTRHIEDSLQLLDLNPTPGHHWVDLGSGGGLPGIVVGCAVKGSGTVVSMVESDRRKATFLRRTVAELGLDARVICDRAEVIAPLDATTLSARALAPLRLLLSYANRHLAIDGVALLPKGISWKDEMTDARADWNFNVEVHPSRTGDGAILEIRNIRAR